MKTTIYPIEVLVNYWELKPPALAARLAELKLAEVTHLASFVPQSVFESDVTHSFKRFIEQVSDRGFYLNLIVSPEVGVDAPYAGVPKEIAKNKWAETKDQKNPIHFNGTRLNILPSLFDSEWMKSYTQFLGKVDLKIAECFEESPEFKSRLKVSMSGSYFKYYRSWAQSEEGPFNEETGDFSSFANQAFKEWKKVFTEDSDWMGIDSTQETSLRAQFMKTAEQDFRSLQQKNFCKRARDLKLEHIELYAPECDPCYAPHEALSLVMNQKGSLIQLSELTEEFLKRRSTYGSHSYKPMIHFVSTGSFSGLPDQQKQFLFLSSLIKTLQVSGSILIHDDQWLAFKQGFKKRVDRLVKQMILGNPSASYEEEGVKILTSHLWSGSRSSVHSVQKVFHKMDVPFRSQLIQDTDLLLQDDSTFYLWVEPGTYLSYRELKQLIQFADQGRCVWIPETVEFSQDAYRLLVKLIPSIDKSDSFAVQNIRVGSGKLVYYPCQNLSQEEWRAFIQKQATQMEGITPIGKGEAIRTLLIPNSWFRSNLFVMNPTHETQVAQIQFDREVKMGAMEQDLSQDSSASFYEVEVPPYGILPIQVEGLGENGWENLQDSILRREKRAPYLELIKNEERSL